MRSCEIQNLWESKLIIAFSSNAHYLKIAQSVAFESLNFWHFLPIFVLLRLTCLVTLFDSKLQVFKNSPKLTIFGILFNELLSTQNVKIARFARNVEWDFFCDFQTPCERSFFYSREALIFLKYALWNYGDFNRNTWEL